MTKRKWYHFDAGQFSRLTDPSVVLDNSDENEKVGISALQEQAKAMQKQIRELTNENTELKKQVEELNNRADTSVMTSLLYSENVNTLSEKFSNPLNSEFALKEVSATLNSPNYPSNEVGWVIGSRQPKPLHFPVNKKVFA